MAAPPNENKVNQRMRKKGSSKSGPPPAHRVRLTLLVLGAVLLAGAGWWAGSQRSLTANELRSLDEAQLVRRSEQGPDRLDALCVLGERRWAGPDPGGAAAPYQQAMALDPNDARAVAGYVLSRGVPGFPGWADVVLRELINAQPSHHAGHLALGELCTREGELEEAGKHLREALRLAPQDSAVHYQYGLWSATSAATGKGIEHLEEACRLSPRVALYHVALADLQIHLAQYPAARKHLEIAEALEPGVPTLLYHKGRLLLAGKPSAEDKRQGLEALERAVKLAPDWNMPRLTLGRLLISGGEVERGVKMLEPLVASAPDKQLFATLAQGYYRLGRKADGDHLITLYEAGQKAAREDSDQWLAAKRAGQDVRPRLARARQVRQRGQALQALYLYRAALAVEPDNQEAKKAIDELIRRP